MKRRYRILDGLTVTAGDFQITEGEPSSVAWHQIALEGSWKGHWMGAFSVTPAMLRQMVDQFEGSEIDTVVDFEHASVFGSDASPAAGWIKAMQVRKAEDGQAQLWAQVNWTSRASGMIRANEYRYVSPTIAFNARDRISGKQVGARLHSLALTNTPFLHELPEVRLNSFRAALQHLEPEPPEGPMDKEQFAALCAQLGLDPEKTDVDGVMAALKANKTAMDELKITAANSTETEATIATMSAQLATLTEKDAQRSAEQLVENEQRLGKVGARDSDSWNACMALASENPDRFKAFMATVKEGSVSPVIQSTVPNADPARASQPGVASIESDPHFKAYNDQCGITEDDLKAAKEAGIIN